MPSESRDPAQVSLRHRMAAHVMHALHDSKETTAAARAAFEGRWEDQVDPDRVLHPAERARRAEHAKKAYFTKLALLSAKARAGERDPSARLCRGCEGPISKKPGPGRWPHYCSECRQRKQVSGDAA